MNDQRAVEVRAERLKERIYVTFTGLAVVVALRSHGNELTAAAAAVTLIITVAGTLLAALVADLMSHLAIRAAVPTGAQLRHMVGLSLGSITVIGVPLAFLLAASLGIWTTATALRASSFALVATLVLVSYLAVRRVKLPGWARLVILFGEFFLGLLVLILELLAHG